MDVSQAAATLLQIINEEIEQMGYARYSRVRDELVSRGGEDWIIVTAKGRRNFSPILLKEFKSLPGWQSIEFQAPRQRWRRKPEDR